MLENVMPYRKEELEKSFKTIIGQEIFSSLTLPRATEEAAIVLFLLVVIELNLKIFPIDRLIVHLNAQSISLL